MASLQPKPTSWLQGGGPRVVAAPADVWFIVDSVARLYEALRDVDINADNNKQKVAEVCARYALDAFLNANRFEDAYKWACEAQKYDNDNVTAKWCEAEANNELDTRLGRAIRLYRELKFGKGPYAKCAKKQLNAGIKRRHDEQMAKLSRGGHVLRPDSPAKNVRGFGDETVKKLDRKGDDSLEEAFRQVQSWDKPGEKLKTLQKVLVLVDDGPAQGGQHRNLLERTLRACQATSKRIVSCNIRLMNTSDYKDNIFVSVLRDKARNFARLVVKEEADMFVVQEAPGAGLLNQGGENAKECVRDGTFLEELQRNLGEEWDAKSIDVPKIGERKTRGSTTREVDMGESHVFAWRTDAFSLVGEPRLLPEVDDSSRERFHRPPSWCAFDVLRAGEPTRERLVVVSVHLKAVEGGDYSKTKKDIRVLGRAVARLQQQPDQSGSTVMILGDFNADPSLVMRELNEAGLNGFVKHLNEMTPTNMHRFCKNGAPDDGHVYDGVYSNNSDRVEGGVLTVSEVDDAYDQMKDKAKQLTGGELGTIMRRMINGGDAPIEAKDGVPSWLRLRVQEEVYRQWSDHMPIYATYSCGN